MKEIIANVVTAIFNYFFELFHLVADCFNISKDPKDKNENILGFLRAGLVALPIIIAIICCCIHYSNNPFVPASGSMLGFTALSMFYTFDAIFAVILMITVAVFLFKEHRGPDLNLALKLLLFNFIFMPIIVFCVTNLYLLIALVVIIILIVVFSKMVIKNVQEDNKPKRKSSSRSKREPVRDSESHMPPPLDGRPYTKNRNGNKFRVENPYRLKAYVDMNGNMVIATNSFGEPSVDLGLERDFRNGKLIVYDENDQEINLRQVKHV